MTDMLLMFSVGVIVAMALGLLLGTVIGLLHVRSHKPHRRTYSVVQQSDNAPGETYWYTANERGNFVPLDGQPEGRAQEIKIEVWADGTVFMSGEDLLNDE